MDDIFTIKNIKKIENTKEILKGRFGIEREGLRTDKNGQLSLTKHPEIFGDKIKNPLITTDFSESQIEIITPCLNSIDETYKVLNTLTDIINTKIPKNEYFWNQSIPCKLPPKNQIPIAKYTGGKKAQKAEKYRENLVKKYGTQKQMISGIHYNFSIAEETIKILYKKLHTKETYREFKNQLYLKITRNYFKYGWLVIYLTGSTIAAHQSYTKECLEILEKLNQTEYYTKKGPSIRNGSTGYKNQIPLHPRYETLKEFIEDVEIFIKEEKLTEAKELYTPIRLKAKDNENLLESLKTNGIQYVEIRSIDINPFEKIGLNKKDMEIIHLFLIFMLLKEESNYENWQKEADYNYDKTAEYGYQNPTLIKDGEEITLKKWANEITIELKELNDSLELEKDDLIKIIEKRIENVENTYGRKLLKLIEKEGYINSNMKLAIENKNKSKISIKKFDELDEEYENMALKLC